MMRDIEQAMIDRDRVDAVLCRAFLMMTDNEALAIVMYCGAGANQQRVAHALCVTQPRASALIRQALDKIRKAAAL